MSSLLHAADISNPCKTWNPSKRWANLILKEFLVQGDREKLEGLPISPNCDRNSCKSPQFFIDFIDFIVAPQYLALRELIPGSQECLSHLIQNRSQWNEQLTKNLCNDIKDKKKRDDEIEKWKKRGKTFHDKYFPKHELNFSKANRRNSAMMLQDLLLANST